MKESDLSLPLIAYLKGLGYCVHGEVSIFDRLSTVDHIAHTGPCDHPENIVLLEMKLALNAALLAQVLKSDIAHYAHGLYVVTPKKAKYDTSHPLWVKTVCLGRWYIKPGWITIDKGGCLEVVCDPIMQDRRYFLKNSYRLLLNDRNQDQTAGHKSGTVDLETHWKAGVRYVEASVQRAPQEVSMRRLLEDAPAFLHAYKNPKQALRRMVKFLRLRVKP